MKMDIVKLSIYGFMCHEWQCCWDMIVDDFILNEKGNLQFYISSFLLYIWKISQVSQSSGSPVTCQTGLLVARYMPEIYQSQQQVVEVNMFKELLSQTIDSFH